MWAILTVGQAATEEHIVVEADIFLKKKRVRKNTVNTCRPVYLQCPK
jgi:hypothetical protein